ncbi:MAG: SUMF1/EgtB/PvdO family nonheme iron enzyme, partial [Verrucomicrobiales bacterium]
NKNANDNLHVAGVKKSNGWGLYDMHGNVQEWVYDRYSNYDWYVNLPYDREWSWHFEGESLDDPWGSPIGRFWVIRGGTWSFDARCCRSAIRGWHNPWTATDYFGFRVASGSNHCRRPFF